MNERKIMLVTGVGGILLVACISGLIYMKSEEIEKSRQNNETLRSEIESARVIIGGTADLEREVIVPQPARGRASRGRTRLKHD